MAFSTKLSGGLQQFLIPCGALPFSGLGVFVLIVSLVLSLLLFAVGRLVGYIAALGARLVAFEAHSEPAH